MIKTAQQSNWHFLNFEFGILNLFGIWDFEVSDFEFVAS
jgi:hypothetical protein